MNNSKNIMLKFFSNLKDLSLEQPTILLEMGGKRILVDPGRKENENESEEERKTKVDEIISRFELKNLDAIIITHYHGDHSNLLGDILQKGLFKGPIICHSATSEIIHNYYDNVKNYSKQFKPRGYNISLKIFDKISITFFNSGHVIGSSMVSIKYNNKNIMITGDLGAKSLPMVREPDTILSPNPIDILIVDAKQVGKRKLSNEKAKPLGDILYHKIKDCFLFDEGNILIYAPLIQIPMLLYCMNYIFDNENFKDVHKNIFSVYLDSQLKLRQLLKIFQKYVYLFDKDEPEYLLKDKEKFSFKKLEKNLPQKNEVHNSIIITPNRNNFIKFFKKFKNSEENDVLLINNTLYYALQKNNSLIDENCHIQVKRLPFLHYHPDKKELIDFCNKIKGKVNVNKLILYHYRNSRAVEKLKKEMVVKNNWDVELVHYLNEKMIII